VFCGWEYLKAAVKGLAQSALKQRAALKKHVAQKQRAAAKQFDEAIQWKSTRTFLLW
jgi:hypothetical protein